MSDTDDEQEEEFERHQISMKLLAHLGRVYTLLCDGTLARKTFQRGLDASEEWITENSTHHWNNVFWREYFRSQLSLTMIYLGDHTAAISLLREGIKGAKVAEQHELGVMYSLTVVQAELLRFTNGKTVEKYLRKAEKTIDRLVSELADTASMDKQTEEPSREKTLISHPRPLVLIVHMLIMRSTYLLHIGDTDQLKKALTQLQTHLQQLTRSTREGSFNMPYEWMNHKHLFTVSLILSTMYHRLSGSVKKVEGVVGRAFTIIQSMYMSCVALRCVALWITRLTSRYYIIFCKDH